MSYFKSWMAYFCKVIHDFLLEGGKDMQIENVGNINTIMNYQNKAVRIGEETQFSPLEVREEIDAESSGQSEKIPLEFSLSGMAFEEWLQSMVESGRAHKMPVVNQIVTAKNPENGEYNIVEFTDDKIRCETVGDGKRVWELDISDDNREKVKDYFKKFKPTPWAEELYYDWDNNMRMGMAVVKDFWLKLFEK